MMQEDPNRLGGRQAKMAENPLRVPLQALIDASPHKGLF